MGEGGTERAEDCTFFYGKRNEDHQGQVFSYISESYQQLGEQSLLVIGCHI
jgi:hypothetical protein